MKLYIEQNKLGDYANISFYAALEAYFNMGFEIITIENQEAFELVDSTPNIALGSIQFIHQFLKHLHIEIPQPLDYPDELRKYLGREIYESTINEISANPSNWNVFVKPKGFVKKFTGRLIKSTADLVGCGDLAMNVPVWVSEPVHFIAEWRVYVRYGQILGAKMYKGDWRAQFDYKIIEKAVKDFNSAPAGYSLDFGITDDGRTLLVEANDGYSLGFYGLFYVDYAKLLASRWAELTKQEDLCNF